MAIKNQNANLKNVAIIMDGNGRWARKNSLKISQGHKKGVQIVREIVEESILQNIDCLLYTSPSPRDATLSRMPSSA